MLLESRVQALHRPLWSGFKLTEHAARACAKSRIIRILLNSVLLGTALEVRVRPEAKAMFTSARAPTLATHEMLRVVLTGEISGVLLWTLLA